MPEAAKTISQKAFYLDSFPALSIYAAWIVTQDLQVKETLNQSLTEWRHVKPYTTGYNLQERGLPPGPRYKEILSRLRAAWLDAEINSEEGEVVLLGKLIAET
jgi:tRNA nucleotidyltransferase (CCA-adding enzyme)